MAINKTNWLVFCFSNLCLINSVNAAPTKSLMVPQKTPSLASTHTVTYKKTTNQPILSNGNYLQTPSKEYNYKAGPYVGFSIGPRIMVTGTPLQYVGVDGTLSVGYGHLWNQWFYLGGEIFGGNSIRMKNFGPQNIAQARIKNVRTSWNYGFDAIPGIMINDHTLGYVRGGVVNTRFQIQTAQFSVVETDPTGWRVGVGMQTNVYKNLDVRFDYIYNQFYRQTNPIPIGRPVMNLFEFGVVYRFV